MKEIYEKTLKIVKEEGPIESWSVAAALDVPKDRAEEILHEMKRTGLVEPQTANVKIGGRIHEVTLIWREA